MDDMALAGRLDAVVATALADHASPGIQLAVARNGKITIVRGYGLASLETDTPTTPGSIFRIASLSKQFTAAGIIRLAAVGRLQLDAPVARYLPFMDKLPAMSLLELMNQTAGLHSDETEAAPEPRSSRLQTQVDLAREIAGQGTAMDFPPGTAWLYSNANYIVLGAVIEAVTRRPFGEAMRRLVFEPLGLDHTAMDHAADVVRGRASGYSPVESGPAAFERAAWLDIAKAGGAGALRSTASDLCKWHAGLLAGRLFDASWIGKMTAPGRLRDGRLSGANRFSPNDTGYGEVQYACGLLVSPASEPHPSLLHYGYIDGFAAMLQTFVHDRTTIAVLCNADVGPATPFRAIRKLVVETLA